MSSLKFFMVRMACKTMANMSISIFKMSVKLKWYSAQATIYRLSNQHSVKLTLLYRLFWTMESQQHSISRGRKDWWMVLPKQHSYVATCYTPNRIIISVIKFTWLTLLILVWLLTMPESIVINTGCGHTWWFKGHWLFRTWL